jgi:hypothetical protein
MPCSRLPRLASQNPAGLRIERRTDPCPVRQPEKRRRRRRGCHAMKSGVFQTVSAPTRHRGRPVGRPSALVGALTMIVSRSRPVSSIRRRLPMDMPEHAALERHADDAVGGGDHLTRPPRLTTIGDAKPGARRSTDLTGVTSRPSTAHSSWTNDYESPSPRGDRVAQRTGALAESRLPQSRRWPRQTP